MLSRFQRNDRIEIDCEPLTRVSHQVNEIALSQAGGKSTSFLSRVFPSKVQRTAIKGKMRMVEQQCDNYIEGLKLLNEAQLTRVYEAQHQMLSKERVTGREKVIAELLSSRDSLALRLRQINDLYVQEFNKRHTQAEGLRDKAVRDAAIAQLQGEFCGFVELQNKLLDEANRMISFVLSAPY